MTGDAASEHGSIETPEPVGADFSVGDRPPMTFPEPYIVRLFAVKNHSSDAGRPRLRHYMPSQVRPIKSTNGRVTRLTTVVATTISTATAGRPP